MHFKAVGASHIFMFHFFYALVVAVVCLFFFLFLLYRISEISTISVRIHEAFGVMNCTCVCAPVCAGVCTGVCECSYVCIINQIFYIHLCVCLSAICMCFFCLSLSPSLTLHSALAFDSSIWAFVWAMGRGRLASDSLLINSISCHLPLFS